MQHYYCGVTHYRLVTLTLLEEHFSSAHFTYKILLIVIPAWSSFAVFLQQNIQQYKKSLKQWLWTTAVPCILLGRSYVTITVTWAPSTPWIFIRQSTFLSLVDEMQLPGYDVLYYVTISSSIYRGFDITAFDVTVLLCILSVCFTVLYYCHWQDMWRRLTLADMQSLFSGVIKYLICLHHHSDHIKTCPTLWYCIHNSCSHLSLSYVAVYCYNNT